MPLRICVRLERPHGRQTPSQSDRQEQKQILVRYFLKKQESPRLGSRHLAERLHAGNVAAQSLCAGRASAPGCLVETRLVDKAPAPPLGPTIAEDATVVLRSMPKQRDGPQLGPSRCSPQHTAPRVFLPAHRFAEARSGGATLEAPLTHRCPNRSHQTLRRTQNRSSAIWGQRRAQGTSWRHRQAGPFALP